MIIQGLPELWTFAIIMLHHAPSSAGIQEYFVQIHRTLRIGHLKCHPLSDEFALACDLFDMIERLHHSVVWNQNRIR